MPSFPLFLNGNFSHSLFWFLCSEAPSKASHFVQTVNINMVVQLPSDSLVWHLLASIYVSKLILLLACKKCELSAPEMSFIRIHSSPCRYHQITVVLWNSKMRVTQLSPSNHESIFPSAVSVFWMMPCFLRSFGMKMRALILAHSPAPSGENVIFLKVWEMAKHT